MSNAPGNTEKMDPAVAQQVLFNEVYMPVLLDKCAAAGVRPRDQEEVKQIVEMAGMLRNAYEADQASQATKTASYSLISAGRERLDGALTQHGLGPTAEDVADRYIKQASFNAITNPTLKQAALAHQDGLVRDLAALSTAAS